MMDLPVFAYQPSKVEARAEPEVTVVMLPYVKKPDPVIREIPKPKPILEPEPEPKEEVQATPKNKPLLPERDPDESEGLKLPKQRFARTTAAQEGVPDADTNILGERDTRAASELPAAPGAISDRPAQEGVAPLYPGHVETVNRTYQDGSLGRDKSGELTEVPQEASASSGAKLGRKPDSSSKSLAEGVSPPEAQNTHLALGEKKPTQQVGQDADDSMESIKKENPKDDRRKEEDADKIAEKESKKESAKESTEEAETNLSDGGVEQDPKKDGFSGYSRQTRVTGSITRQGKSALNVRNSALGRYQALISSAVELQWRRNCEQHRDHIVPGVISIRFYVDENGGVSGIKFQEVIGANFIERGFTQRALRQVELPEMPQSVKEELKGESLELIYNFYF
ncbi:MAG: hypothetical protein P8P36_09640 [Akkermansiaceae bacterium]|nr:hypothetical protein [Akkermansiaceae bacterium]